MKAVVIARVVDVVESEFENFEGEAVKYLTISCIDEDAFMDRDRVVVLTAKKELLEPFKGVIGSTCQLRGILTRDKGVMKFKVEDIVKSEPKKE